MTNWSKIRTQLGNRSAIVAAGTAGFLVGAGGLVAARIDDSAPAELKTEIAAEIAADTENEVQTRGSVATSSSTSVAPAWVDLTVPMVTIDDSPTTSIDDSTSSSAPDTTVDDSPADSVPVTTNDDDTTSSSAPDTTVDDSPADSVPVTTNDDDTTSSSAPDTTVDDDATTSSVPAALPAAFTRSYQSFGGSIEVTWTGTTFVLETIDPALGFAAEIEDQSPDRIRVNFEGEGDEVRIEVRVNDGQIRVRVD